jgi:hypothetical protein
MQGYKQVYALEIIKKKSYQQQAALTVQLRALLGPVLAICECLY